MSEPEPLNAFQSIEGLLNTEVDDLILPAYFWEQSDVPSPWNIYWTEAAAYGGGLELDNLYSEIVGPSTGEPTLGSIVTLGCPVSVKDIIV